MARQVTAWWQNGFGLGGKMGSMTVPYDPPGGIARWPNGLMADSTIDQNQRALLSRSTFTRTEQANKEFHSHDIAFKRLCRPFPAACCLSKCNNCRPCKPVMALVRPVYSQEYDLDYYPQDSSISVRASFIIN
ncbi:hypothetical protein QQ045_007944 [Rhodiola kirilowii]